MEVSAQTELLETDTPPSSPAGPNSFQHNQFGDRRVLVDEHGAHDFDFKKRLQNPGSRKLKKNCRRSNLNQRSISSMTDTPTRSPSVESDTSSVRKRFSSLFTGNRDTLNKSHNAKSVSSVPEAWDDPMPDTKKELEVRLNHHLVELDMLKKIVQAANDVISQQQERYEILQGRGTPDMKIFMQRMRQMVQQARENRDSYAQFVSFHRRQIERIRHRRIEIEMATGLDPTLPEVFNSMWTDDDWAKLFAS